MNDTTPEPGSVFAAQLDEATGDLEAAGLGGDGLPVGLPVGAGDVADLVESPAVCLTCSADGAGPHQCDDPADCPCGSEFCGIRRVDEVTVSPAADDGSPGD